MRDVRILAEGNSCSASASVSPKSSEGSKSDMRDVSSKGSDASDNSRSPWDAVGSEASHAGIDIDVKAEEVSTVKAEEVSRDEEVKPVAAMAVKAMDVLRDKPAAPVGMRIAEFGEKIWPRQEEHSMQPESDHPPAMIVDGGSSSPRRSRGDVQSSSNG